NSGREFDHESGLYFHRARYYDSLNGRFLGMDQDSGDLNRPLTFINKYAYASNDPVNMVDPSGNFSLSGSFNSLFNGGLGGFSNLGFSLNAAMGSMKTESD